MKHSHMTRDIKDLGDGCPACDEYHVTVLRADIDLCARKLHKAFVSGDMTDFHLRLGMIVGLGSRLYEANAALSKSSGGKAP